MRMGTYNVLGLRGQPAAEEAAAKEIGLPGDEANVALRTLEAVPFMHNLPEAIVL